MSTIKVLSGIRLAYKEWGALNAKPIIASHGWLDNSNTFNLLGPYLASKGYRFIAYDGIGHGYSDHLGIGASYSSFKSAALLAELLDSLGWESCHVLGHSMGANISAIFAAAYPDRVKKLVMIEGLGPLARPVEEMVRNLRAAYDAEKSMYTKMLSPSFPKQYKTVDDAITARLRAVSFYPGQQYITQEAAAHIIARAVNCVASPELQEDLVDGSVGPVIFRHDPRLVLSNYKYDTHEQALEVLKAIQAPTMLITAERGWPFDPVRYGEREKILENNGVLTHIQLPGSHHLHLDEVTAEATAKHIEAFLEQSI